MTQTTSWQRLEAVIHYAKMTTNAFAKKLSLKRSENLYQIKKGKNGISKDLAELIVKNYPEINKLWLLTGEGDGMFASNAPTLSIPTRKGIPYYDSDIESVVNNRAALTPLYYLDIPLVKECDFVVKFFGNAMEPRIGSGAMVFAMQVDPKIILFGQIYLVSTLSGAVIRVVKKGSDENKILLVAANSNYEEIEIEKDSIESLYIIKGVYQAFI